MLQKLKEVCLQKLRVTTGLLLLVQLGRDSGVGGRTSIHFYQMVRRYVAEAMDYACLYFRISMCMLCPWLDKDL